MDTYELEGLANTLRDANGELFAHAAQVGAGGIEWRLRRAGDHLLDAITAVESAIYLGDNHLIDTVE